MRVRERLAPTAAGVSGWSAMARAASRPSRRGRCPPRTAAGPPWSAARARPRGPATRPAIISRERGRRRRASARRGRRRSPVVAQRHEALGGVLDRALKWAELSSTAIERLALVASTRRAARRPPAARTRRPRRVGGEHQRAGQHEGRGRAPARVVEKVVGLAQVVDAPPARRCSCRRCRAPAASPRAGRAGGGSSSARVRYVDRALGRASARGGAAGGLDRARSRPTPRPGAASRGGATPPGRRARPRREARSAARECISSRWAGESSW